MAALAENGLRDGGNITVNDYKVMVAKAKLFRDVNKVVRPMFAAFQGNVTIYVVSLLARKLGEHIDFDRIWAKQAVSLELLQQAADWAREVNERLHHSASGRMISEWAKKAECKETILGATYSPVRPNIPELRDY